MAEADLLGIILRKMAKSLKKSKITLSIFIFGGIILMAFLGLKCWQEQQGPVRGLVIAMPDKTRSVAIARVYNIKGEFIDAGNVNPGNLPVKPAEVLVPQADLAASNQPSFNEAVPGKKNDLRDTAQSGVAPEVGDIMEGPVSRRKMTTIVYPEYPEWAREKGIETEVQVKFTVLSAGKVNNIVLEKTSGYKDFDEAAKKAVGGWIFEPVAEKAFNEDEWGKILILFKLE